MALHPLPKHKFLRSAMNITIENMNYKSHFFIIIITDNDEIPGFLLSLKNHIFTAHSKDTIFYGGPQLSHQNQMLTAN